MFRAQYLSRSESRRGVILMVVLALLTLFAIIGVSFVYYADAEAKAAQINREAEVQTRPEIDPELLASFFLGQLVYDVKDDQTGVYSSLRGHSLARSLYGWNSDNPASNVVPFNGTGRLRTGPVTYPPGAPPGTGISFPDDYNIINYTYFFSDGFLRDPERLSARTSLGSLPGPYTGGFNVPYTYPDPNNMLLAAVKADGTVLMRSFHRDYLFNPGVPLNNVDPTANPNWANVQGKYYLLRPREVDQRLSPLVKSAFPDPEDAGGDVKNLIGSPGFQDPTTGTLSNNDSVWIDLGFPVKTAPDGRKFKPLFAALIIPLDNRVNLNVHGNRRGVDAVGNPSHASNQGWGPWAVNLSKVMTSGTEWTNLFGGTSGPTILGRYGLDTSGSPVQPGAGGLVALPGHTPHFYGQVDLDESNESTSPPGAPTAPISLPVVGPPTYSCFPTFPTGYGNGGLAERTNHPLLYNIFQPTFTGTLESDRAFQVSNMEALLRYGDTGTASLTSELFRLAPTNFITAPSANRTRNLVTTHSFDFDRPAGTPWVWDPTAAASQFLLPGPGGPAYPTGSAISFPSLSLRTSAAVPTNSEFRTPGAAYPDPTVDWRSSDAFLGRLDLNRDLPDYPSPDPTTGKIDTTIAAVVAQFAAAQSARQQMANDIFLRLAKVTGAADPLAPATTPGTAQYNALRWLAQLAVNIVDYIDSDDYMTPFYWNPNPLYATDVVFGTELPRAVVNEAYVQYTPPPPGMPTTVNVWVELYNPFSLGDTSLSDSGAARLDTNYQLSICSPDPTPATYLRRYDNVWGTPKPINPGDPNLVYTIAGGADATVSTFTPALLLPSGGAPSGPSGGNAGFYMIGPAAFPGAGAGGPAPTLTSPGMGYLLPAGTPVVPPTVLLQRVACPALPPPPPGSPPTFGVGSFLYNPYVTVDYMEGVMTNNTATTTITSRVSDGRRQPYAAHSTQHTAQTATPAGQPMNTFFSQNVPSTTPPGSPFDWLVHLDRQLISPMELLHVSGYKPHELTQQFVQTIALSLQKYLHYARWFDPTTRLYRLLEFLETGSRSSGTAAGGRVPGKININTIWDIETFRALCDRQVSNGFTDLQVDAIFSAMVSQRWGGGTTFSTSDRPFWSLAAPYCPAGDPQFLADAYGNPFGIERTFLQTLQPAGTPSQRLFEVPPGASGGGGLHPYLADELMTKIFNNVTTRSNVFAVWATVGFFEVTDDTTRPVKLGAEIGRSENRHIRHRMFAIVDRTNITQAGPNNPPPIFIKATSPITLPAMTGPSTVTVDATSGTYEGIPWSITDGATLVVDVGLPAGATPSSTSHQEVVTVTPGSVTATSFQATFTYPHLAGALITGALTTTTNPVPGNPGPQRRYNPRQDPAVVRYFSIIH